MIDVVGLLMALNFGQKQIFVLVSIIIVGLIVLLFVGILIKNMISAKKSNESLPSLVELGLEDDPDDEVEEDEDFKTAFNLNDDDDDLDEDNEADVVLRETRAAGRKVKRKKGFFKTK